MKQSELAVAIAKVAVANSASGAVFTLTFAGQLIEIAEGVAVTVTLKAQLSTFPHSSANR